MYTNTTDLMQNMKFSSFQHCTLIGLVYKISFEGILFSKFPQVFLSNVFFSRREFIAWFTNSCIAHLGSFLVSCQLIIYSERLYNWLALIHYSRSARWIVYQFEHLLPCGTFFCGLSWCPTRSSVLEVVLAFFTFVLVCHNLDSINFTCLEYSKQ